jgi:hypothetical protein
MRSLTDELTLEAATLLRRNEHGKAAQLFRQCLGILRDDEITRRGLHTGPQARSQNDSVLRSLSVSDGDVQGKQSLQDNVFSFFDRVFLLSLVGEDMSDEGREIRAATMLYNMGLCHHHSGIVKNGNNRHFQRALFYYQMAYESIDEDRPVTEMTVHVLLALANNMGHLFALALDHTAMRLCHESFIFLVSLTSIDSTTMSESDRQFFCFSTNCFLSMELNASPAA